MTVASAGYVAIIINFSRLVAPGADFTKLGQRFQKVADKRFAKSRTTDAIDFRLPCFCYG
jgi:hypothetical protein